MAWATTYANGAYHANVLNVWYQRLYCISSCLTSASVKLSRCRQRNALSCFVVIPKAFGGSKFYLVPHSSAFPVRGLRRPLRQHLRSSASGTSWKRSPTKTKMTWCNPPRVLVANICFVAVAIALLILRRPPRLYVVASLCQVPSPPMTYLYRSFCPHAEKTNRRGKTPRRGVRAWRR